MKKRDEKLELLFRNMTDVYQAYATFWAFGFIVGLLLGHFAG